MRQTKAFFHPHRRPGSSRQRKERTSFALVATLSLESARAGWGGESFTVRNEGNRARLGRLATAMVLSTTAARRERGLARERGHSSEGSAGVSLLPPPPSNVFALFVADRRAGDRLRKVFCIRVPRLHDEQRATQIHGYVFNRFTACAGARLGEGAAFPRPTTTRTRHGRQVGGTAVGFSNAHAGGGAPEWLGLGL